MNAMTDAKTIAVIGAGNGGFNLVAHLGVAGHRMRLHDIDDEKLTELRTAGGVDTGGLGTGFAKLDLATTDLSAAVAGADVIVVCTGGHRQASAATALAPILADGQTILLVQGNTGGSLVFRRVLDRAGCRARIELAEMDNYPYSARKVGPAKIQPVVTKRWLQIASFPGGRIDAVFANLGPLFPTAVKAPNVIHTGFTNANAMLHVANCVLNATRIEHGESYKFYSHGVTEGVARIYRAINAERVKAAAALGATVPSLEDWFDRVYKVREATLVEAMQKLTFNADGPYGGTPSPKSFDNNYVAEDVPVGLMPMAAIGTASGVAMPATRTLIDMAKLMTGNDYEATGRTLETMGLAGLDAAGIRKIVDHGFG
jgi:opine dehydrogenase